MPKLFLPLVCALLLTSGLAAEDVFSEQWFTSDIGLGWSPAVAYPPEAQSFMKLTQGSLNERRIVLNVHLDVGIPVGRASLAGLPSADLYAVVSTGGYLTALDADSERAQLNNHVYDAGLQSVWGPLSVKVCAGVEYAQGDHAIQGQTTEFNTGLGPNVMLKAAYEFNTTKGPGLGLGVVADAAWLDSSFYGQFGLEASLTYF